MGGGRWYRVSVAVAILIPSVLLAALVTEFAYRASLVPGRPPFIDWLTHSNAVWRALSGAPLFAPGQITGPYLLPDVTPDGWAYPPPSIIPLAPFAVSVVGLPAWLALNVGLLISGIWAAIRRDLPDRTGMPFAIALLGLLVFFLPFVSGVVSANTNVAIAGIFAWCWAIGRADGRVGVVAALLATIKIYPGVLILWPTGQARRRSVAWAVGVVIALTAISLPIVGLQSWLDFPVAIANAQLSCGDSRVSVACLLLPALGTTGSKAVGLILGLVFLLAALRVKEDRLAFVLFGAAMLAPVPDGHLHYWLIAYVALVVAASGYVASRRRRRRSTGDTNEQTFPSMVGRAK